MGNFVELSGNKEGDIAPSDAELVTTRNSNMPSYDMLKIQLDEATLLIDDLVLKNYLTKLSDLDVVPLPEELKRISDIRFFKINEMVYQKDEYSTYKFASVFNSVQNLNCGVFLIVDSDGKKTNFYMGVRSLDDERTTKSLKDTLKNTLSGHFPGVKTTDLLDDEAQEFLQNMPSKHISAVSCVAQNKDEEFNDNNSFIQGLEKLTLAMQGQRYTAVVLAKGASSAQLLDTRRAYEAIYTQISPFANMQLSYGTQMAMNISDAFSKGTSTSTSNAMNTSLQKGTSDTKGTSSNQSETQTDRLGMIGKGVATSLLGVASLVTAPLTGGGSLVAAGAIMTGSLAVNAIQPKTKTEGTSITENYTKNTSETRGETYTSGSGTSENYTQTKGLTNGTTDTMQLTMQNKTIIDTLDRIGLQLKRMDEFESLGMWECATYFLSDTQETAEMAASLYKALMKGTKSGVETSAINYWGRQSGAKLPLIREYVTNFIHPEFIYHSPSAIFPVTASSLVSSNELAIQMGLPRKSVGGFPVIEHAEFGSEVVKYSNKSSDNEFIIGSMFTMGKESSTKVRLSRDSMTMHTFITGSTGSGKSNATYEILYQLKNVYNVPFLVIEPAKGEYKNVFGHAPDVTVYGTNPKLANLLKINLFRFPAEVHVLEHLDRLVELFNVCWPMYAAMPAILKDAMERAYMIAGWDLETSENTKGRLYPNFVDLLEQIETVINESKYSADSKGDYSGALITRIRSLTNGLNGLIFCHDDLTDEELFDRNVIVDLSRIGSVETKALIMGLLVMKLNEYRMSSSHSNSVLQHITVLEEAHHLLKRTSTEQSSDGANLLGKSVEMLSNSIAEMRTYGEGFIIVDQSPGLLDLSVIRNTNTKIILRLPELSDRELVGYSAALDDDQVKELAKLEQGVAAIHQNDWVDPVLVKISKCELQEKPYQYYAQENSLNRKKITEMLVHLLLQGRVHEKLDFEVDEIEGGLHTLNLTVDSREFIEEQLLDYRENHHLELWRDDQLQRLARHITTILGVRERVEKLVLSTASHEDLTDRLIQLGRQLFEDASYEVLITLSQCFMKDMSRRQEDREVRERIYMQWVKSIMEESRGQL